MKESLYSVKDDLRNSKNNDNESVCVSELKPPPPPLDNFGPDFTSPLLEHEGQMERLQPVEVFN